MKTVTVREAQTNFPELLQVVQAGEEIKVIRKKKAVAKIVPVSVGIAKEWKEIMAEVWAAQKAAPGKTPNPVLAERRRR